MPHSAHAHARLGGALVLPGLQTDDVLSSLQLFLGELTDVLLGRFGADRWASETVALRLYTHHAQTHSVLFNVCTRAAAAYL